MSSRYYNPEIGRWINEDAIIGQVGNIHGHNMFAYCFNNPVNMSDPSGKWPSLSQILTAVAVVSTVVAVAAVCVATAGLATVAVAGGTMLMATATTTAALGVAATAGKVALAATGVAVVSKGAEKSHERKMRQNNTVYRLVDEKNQTQYVGRTSNVAARKKVHKKNPARQNLELEIIAPNLNYYQARGLEQIAMLEYHTISTANRINNQINGISPFNKSLGIYMAAGRGVAGYLGNQISNEILYWTGN